MVKARRKSLFRLINDWLHLWLGIVVGILIVIISITGCLYVFERDLRDYTEPYRFIRLENKPYLPPSALCAIGEKYAGVKALGVQYGIPGEAAAITYTKKPQGFTYLYLNPYTGAVIREKILNRDFFRIMLAGHFYLWLPPAIGKPVVNIATLIFVFLLISGLIMWWPRRWNRAYRKKSFTIGWKASFKRLNYDLHNVLGFYILLVAFAIAVTGLEFGFTWFTQAYRYTLTGGKPAMTKRPVSDTTVATVHALTAAEDLVWARAMNEYKPIAGLLQVNFPQANAEAITVNYNPERKTYYKRILRYFDRYTAKEITPPRKQKNLGQRIIDTNYDIHVGAVFGMPGKILAFFASLACATLPVTGFLIWLGRRKKKKPIAPVTGVA